MVFAVEDAGKLIGVMSLNSIDHEHKQCALDYWIGKPFWGMGHGTAAAQLAISHAQRQLGIQNITSACLEGNIGSQRVLEKCGFQLTRTAPYNGPFPDRFSQQSLRHYRLEVTAN